MTPRGRGEGDLRRRERRRTTMRLPDLRATRYLGLVVTVAACASKPPPYTAAPSATPPAKPAADTAETHPPTTSAPIQPQVLAAPPPPQPEEEPAEPEPPCKPEQCADDGDAARASDAARALTMYRHGCDSSDMMSCRRLMRWASDASEQSTARLAACTLGDSSACTEAAAEAGPQSNSTARVLTKEAAELYLLGCESKRTDAFLASDKGLACVRAGSALILGEGVDVDEKRGVSLYQRACAIDYVEGCFQGGKYLLRGLRFRNEKLRGIKLYDRGCALGDSASCNNLGVFYDNDLGFRNRDRALDYFLKACDLKNGRACYNASLIAKKPSPWKLRKLACKHGFKKGCR